MRNVSLRKTHLLLVFAAAGLALGQQDLVVGVSKSSILENQAGVKRISVANPELAEAVAVSKTEVVVNGKAPGETSLILWDLKGQRTVFDVHVQVPDLRPDAVRSELEREMAGQDVTFTYQGGTVFLHGTADDLYSADRAASIVSTLGKVVNLLHVKVSPAEPQILLKVRFADVDRTALQQLGVNILSTGATNTIGGISTGQFGGQPTFDVAQGAVTTTFNDLLNIFLYRKDLNLGAAIEALEQKQVAQILAEPNLLTMSGHPANFLAGGEFPYPTLQGGGSGIGQITVQFREFGVRLHFLPTITPRGTIQIEVTPEVSSLDYANGLSVSGYTVPGLDTRRVQSEVELASGQSFVIAGLLDNRTTENLSKMPGLGDIPLLGKLFQSRSVQKTNTELLIVVTPELVQPIPVGDKIPAVKMPTPFMKGTAANVPQNPIDHKTTLPVENSVPIEIFKGPARSDDSSSGPPDPGPKRPSIPAGVPFSAPSTPTATTMPKSDGEVLTAATNQNFESTPTSEASDDTAPVGFYKVVDLKEDIPNQPGLVAGSRAGAQNPGSASKSLILKPLTYATGAGAVILPASFESQRRIASVAAVQDQPSSETSAFQRRWGTLLNRGRASIHSGAHRIAAALHLSRDRDPQVQSAAKDRNPAPGSETPASGSGDSRPAPVQPAFQAQGRLPA